ncbi:PEP-CTERM sorting domain-containing protein [Roseateles sp. P5_D6]
MKQLKFTLAALSLVASTAMAAGVTNGDFTGGLTGWAKAGNVAVDTTSQFGAPPAGFTAQAVLGTADTSGFLFGGSAVAAASLESFAGLGAASLSGMGAVVGSGLSADFTAAAGERLIFQWKFMSNDPPGTPADDTAYVVLDKTTVIKLTSVNSATFLGGSASPLFDETAYLTFTSAPLTAGAHSVSLGVFDGFDALGASALAVADVHLAPVPEPASGLLLLLGGSVLLGLAKRRAS